MAGTKDNEAAALEGLAGEDLLVAEPALVGHFSAKYLGQRKKHLNAEERHQIAARIARGLEAEERERR